MSICTLLTCWCSQQKSRGVEGPDRPLGSHWGFAFDFRGSRAEGTDPGVFCIYRGIRVTSGVVLLRGFMSVRARKLHAQRGNTFYKSKLHLKVRVVKLIGNKKQKKKHKTKQKNPKLQPTTTNKTQQLKIHLNPP